MFKQRGRKGQQLFDVKKLLMVWHGIPSSHNLLGTYSLNEKPLFNSILSIRIFASYSSSMKSKLCNSYRGINQTFPEESIFIRI